MRLIDAVSLDLTTACNRKCSECCCNIPNRQAKHYSWDELENLARKIHGVKRIHLSGGEPTSHPQFGEFVPKLKLLFGCELLTIWTNGFSARENAAVFGCFDTIYVTRYEDNHEVVEWLVNNYGAIVGDGSAHVNRAHRGGGLVCVRGRSSAVAVSIDGRMFPCCVGPGIPGAESMVPCDGWETKILDVPLPCGECWFSE